MPVTALTGFPFTALQLINWIHGLARCYSHASNAHLLPPSFQEPADATLRAFADITRLRETPEQIAYSIWLAKPLRKPNAVLPSSWWQLWIGRINIDAEWSRTLAEGLLHSAQGLQNTPDPHPLRDKQHFEVDRTQDLKRRTVMNKIDFDELSIWSSDVLQAGLSQFLSAERVPEPSTVLDEQLAALREAYDHYFNIDESMRHLGILPYSQSKKLFAERNEYLKAIRAQEAELDAQQVPGV